MQYLSGEIAENRQKAAETQTNFDQTLDFLQTNMVTTHSLIDQKLSHKAFSERDNNCISWQIFTFTNMGTMLCCNPFLVIWLNSQQDRSSDFAFLNESTLIFSNSKTFTRWNHLKSSVPTARKMFSVSTKVIATPFSKPLDSLNSPQLVPHNNK